MFEYELGHDKLRGRSENNAVGTREPQTEIQEQDPWGGRGGGGGGGGGEEEGANQATEGDGVTVP